MILSPPPGVTWVKPLASWLTEKNSRASRDWKSGAAPTGACFAVRGEAARTAEASTALTWFVSRRRLLVMRRRVERRTTAEWEFGTKPPKGERTRIVRTQGREPGGQTAMGRNLGHHTLAQSREEQSRSGKTSYHTRRACF